MPRIPVDYSKTTFYKIISKDPNISDLYIGHTTNFTRRKNQHKQSCEIETRHNYNQKVYQFIRANGGFKNWLILEIETRECKDANEARRIEGEYIRSLNATLNRVIAGRTMKEYKDENKEEIYAKAKVHFDCICGSSVRISDKSEHIKSAKHIQYLEDNELIEKGVIQPFSKHKKYAERRMEKIHCECGRTYNRSNKSTHLNTKVHKQYLKQNTQKILTIEDEDHNKK